MFLLPVMMASSTKWAMVLQEILAMMNTGGKSEGKVHYERIEVSTALWGIMDPRVLR